MFRLPTRYYLPLLVLVAPFLLLIMTLLYLCLTYLIWFRDSGVVFQALPPFPNWPHFFPLRVNVTHAYQRCDDAI